MRPEPFFAYARERYQIFQRRCVAGLKPPWTQDPILQRYRFCNVFREDDDTTRWFREKIRGPLAARPDVLMATIIFRWFNRVEVGEVLLKNRLLRSWDNATARGALNTVRPLTTGAYMTKTPPGMNKLEGLIWCIDNVWEERVRLHQELAATETLEQAWRRLTRFPYLGGFMAYEIVTDLRHTALLGNATDTMTWAHAGPGAARGVSRLLFGTTRCLSYASREDQCLILEVMQRLLGLSQDSNHWPREWPTWEMRDVEHTLCEFDKYERTRLGEGRPRQLLRSQ